MKRKKSYWKKGNMLLLFLAALLLLTACGSSSSDSAKNSAQRTEAAAVEEAAAYDMAAYSAGEGGVAINNGAASTAEGSARVQAAAANRKLIRRVDLNVETENYDELMARLEEQTSRLGGYIEYREAYYGSQYSSGSRSAHLQVRIPQDKLDEFIGRVKEAGNVTQENESVEDVTLAYVDLESHKRMLTTEQERLLELLEKAATIEDIIVLESRLSDVRYQLESMEAQLRTYDNQIDYSTIDLYIEEVERYTPQPEKGTWERIQSGFSDNLYRVGKGLKNFGIEFIIALPVLAVWAMVILIIVLAVRLFTKRERRHNNTKENGTVEKAAGVHLPLLHRKEKKEEKNEEKS